MVQYHFQIASIPFAVEAPREIALDASMTPFLTAGELEPEYRFQVEPMPEGILCGAQLLARRQNVEVYTLDDAVIRKGDRLFSGERADYLLLRRQGERVYHLYLSQPFWREGRLFERDNLFHYLAFEQVLAQCGAVILHASFVRYNGVGLLFSAPSRTGKSTQAALWQQYRNAEIINGDRTVIRKTAEGFFAFGSPQSGSSGIWKNQSAPLRAVILLSQGPENTIETVEKRDAIVHFMREVIVNTWDSSYMDHVFQLLDALIRQIPIYHLSCRPDEGAVELVDQTLFQ